MPGKNKHRGTSLSDFLKYLKGIFTGRERNAFEKELEKDPFVAEAMEGFESLSPEEVENDLLKLHNRLSKRIEKRNRVLYFRIAASIAVIIAVSTLYLTLSDRQLEDFAGAPTVSEAIKEEPLEEVESEPMKEKQKETLAEKSEVTPEGEKSKVESIADDRETFREHKQDPEPEMKAPVKSSKKSIEPVSVPIAETAEPEISEQEVLAEDVQQQAISVPEKGKSLALPQQAVPREDKNARIISSDLARQKVLTGVVLSSEDSLPLPGATIRIRGTNSGTVTNTDGSFIMAGVEEENPTLIASFIGMENKEIKAETNENLEIVLEPSAMSLDEVVVVGYGHPTERALTEAVSEIDDLDQEIENTYHGAYPVRGTADFKDYIEENTIYPDSTVSRAVVVLKFVVTKSGRPSQIEVLKSPSEKFSSEAIRLLKEGPDWVPAENGGQYIEDKTRIRILFKNQP
jgi:outer membrane biosynthesis protein TonB